jgi:Inorganic Pyrophosphatase/Large polyvalent protein associated domain 38/Large polyvalent protein-associated domain 1/Large polyvalent protein-associated domain 5
MAIDPNNPFADLPDTQNDPFADLPDAQQGESGIMPALGAGIDKMQELGYRAVKGFTDVGVPQEEQTNALGRAIGQGGALSRWADEGITRNIEEQKAYTPSVASYKDIDSIGDAASYVGEMTAQSVPMMATALNPAGLFAMGGGLSNEAYEAQPEDNKQPWRATASGFGQAGLERLGVETAIGRVFGGEGKQFVKRVGQSMLGEGVTETGQEALAQWGSGKSFDELENLDEAFVGGALVGGTIRTGTEAGKAAYDKYRGERPELSDIEETDLTQSATSAESVIPDPFADIGPAQDQAVTGNEIEIIPGEAAGDSQPNWQFGQNDMPYRGEVTPYVYDGEYEQYRETPSSVPVGAALEAPVIDGEFERPRGLPNRADTIIGEDGRPMQQAQEFADSVSQTSNRALPFDDVIYAEDKRNVQVKRNGQPFGGRRAAQLTKEFRQAKEQGLNPQVIKVNGGYGWVSEGDNVGLDTGSVEQSSDLQVGSAGVALPRDVRGDKGRRLRESADGTTRAGDAENIALAARRDTNDDALGAEAEGIPTNEGVAYPSEEAQAMPKWKERQARIDSIAKDYVGKLQGETASEQVAQIMSDGHSEIDAQHIATSANMMEMAATSETTSALDQAANEAATSPTNDRPEPTEAQKEAGNYKKGKVRLHGLDISIENPKGSTRKGKDQDGKEWSSEMKHHYGDIKGTTGADGDSIDVFIGDKPESQKVFVVDQIDPKTGEFDEVKVMMGFDDAEAAKSGYLSNYDKNWKGLGEITEASVEDFKAWTKRPRKSKQPFALPVKPKKEEAVTKDQEDWGKKITTARKNISVRWNENSTDEEISSKPLSKTWPEKEFDDVGDTYASAFAFAARGEIPRKPSQSYKKQRWVEKVKNYRQLVKDNVVDGLLTGKITKEKMKELGGKRNLQDFFAKVDLLSELDRKDWSKVERVLSYPDSMDFNPKTDKLDIPNPKTYVRINGRNREFNSTDPKVLAEQIKPFLEEKVEKPQMKFEVRGRKGSYFINKKGDPEYTRLATFDSSKEAFDFIKNNNSKLVESWESHKARVNVTKADIRNKVNKPRTGEDYRNGKNATAEDFQNTFGIKRGTFGKWVKQGKERQDMLNGTYDALMDLANITGVPPKALSLEGKLGFAFGANGRGKAMAHYEPGEVVINLTKTKGAGSLAHEWFHALDNYFQKKRDTLPTTEKGNFITHNPETYYIGPRGYSVPESRFRDMRGINKNEWRRVEGVRPEVAESFKNLVDTLNGLDFAKRSSRLDKGKAGGYWSSNLEMAARAFESYVKAKMSANGYDNDFLANVTSDTDFVRDDNRYPYIKADEIAEVEAAFDDLFNTIESKESDNGDVALFRQGDGPTKTKVKVDGKLFETGKPVTFPYLHNKDSATKMFGIPDKESPFGRGFEPSAKYVTYHDGDKPSYGDFETGEITFNNPLVIDNDNLNWKQALSESYGGKTGKALSKAIIKDGFDGIVTVDGKSISEIVDLTTFDESKALFSAAGTVTSNTNTRTVSRSNANEIVSRFVKGLSSAGKNYVSVVSTYDDLPTDIKYAAKAQGAEYQVKGVFHKGKVHVVLDQHTSALDMETTLFHEAYGHLGIKNLFGDDITKKLNSLFIANGGLKGLRETAKRHGINLEQYIKGLDGTNMPQEVKNRVLMDELLAHMQQSNKPSVKRLAREIVGMVRDKLRKLGLPGLSKVTDSDLFYTLKKARDAANNGPSKSPGETLFRTTDDAAAFSAPVEKKWSKDWFKRKLQDKFAPIKDMQANIEDATGRELPEDQNAYRAEELFYGKTENDLNKMEKNHVKPLVDAMTSNNIDSAELDQFLIAKHARERNAHIASINPEMQDGGSGMTNAEADAILSRYEQEGKLRGLEAAASEVYKITQKRRELMRDAGLEDESLLDVWDATYEFYVPLKGYAEDSEGNSVAKTGSGFDIRGKESMRAMGRRTIAESPTAHAIQDLSATIIRSRKNEVGRTFLKMVEENPNPDIWEVFTEDNPDTERRIVNGEVKENQPIDMRSRKDDYFSVKVDGQSKYIKLKDKDGLLMKAMKNMGPEQMNTFTRSMSEVTRWLSMVNTSLNPEFTVTNFTRDIQTALFNALAEQDLTDGKVKDKAIAMKMIKGSGKAVKSLWQHSAGKLDEADPMYKWIEEFLSDGAKTGYFDSKEVDKIGTDLADLLDMANGTNKGKLLKAKHKIGDFIENVNGGIENGVRLSSYIEARKAGVTREKAASFAKNLTVNFNRKGEIGTFLNSLYMFFNAAVQGNANFARAIITPKVDEVTGKKSLNMAQKVAVGISLASFGWAALMREMAGDDEDDVPYWDKIPKGVRERNFIIPKTLWGGEPGEYLKIPLPYGYNIFYNLGDAAEAAINSDTRKTGDLAAEMALSVYASFVPLGSPVGDNGAESAFLAGTPTIGKPLIEIALNKNFFGGPIYRENNPYGAQLRDSQMSMRSTGEAYKWMTGFMNDVIGDGRSYKVKGESPWYDVSPDSIEHLVEFSLGGLYRFGSRIYDNVAKSAQGGDLDSTDIPFARQLNGKVQPYADITQFYEARQQLKNIDAEMDSLRGKERLEFRKEYGDKLRLQSLMSSLDKRMKQLRKQRDRVEINESLSYEEKEKRLQKIEDQMKTTAARFNKQWNKVN